MDLWMWVQLCYMAWMVRQKGKKEVFAVFPTVSEYDYRSFKEEIWNMGSRSQALPCENMEVTIRLDY